jgi:8-oxo-dGTP pyrophosphatase MutT (NUDIX family)
MDLDLNTQQAIRKTPNPPRDAATLMLVRFDGDSPRILMGQRHGSHAFMPDKYVFPGGRLELFDGRMALGSEGDPQTVEKLMRSMRGKPSRVRARGLLVAAIRETFEETGLLIGRSTPEALFDLSGLVYFARAITPPGRSRRFDSRFFVANANLISNLDNPVPLDSPELLEIEWVTMTDALKLDLPSITRDILQLLQPHLAKNRLPPAGCPISFHRSQGKAWVVDTLSF